MDPFQKIETELNKEEFDAIKHSKQICLLALQLEETFKLLLDNFLEWEVELLQAAQRYVVWRGISHDHSMNDRLAFDRRLVNVLTACRVYLDHTDGIISKCFNNPSDELRGIKAFKSALYYDHFGYRLLEGLRNYVQHRGLVVGIISYAEDHTDSRTGPVSTLFSVAPLIKRSEFVEGEFKKALLLEL
jgi:hypothetical protein